MITDRAAALRWAAMTLEASSYNHRQTGEGGSALYVIIPHIPWRDGDNGPHLRFDAAGNLESWTPGLDWELILHLGRLT